MAFELRSRVSLFVLIALLLAFSTLRQARAEYAGSASAGGRQAQAIDIDDPQGVPGSEGKPVSSESPDGPRTRLQSSTANRWADAGSPLGHVVTGTATQAASS